MALETQPTGEPERDENAHDHDASESVGGGAPPRSQGAYRTSAKPPPEPPPPRVPPVLIAAGVLLVLGVVVSLLPSPAAREQAQLSDAPAMLLEPLTHFPPVEPDLPPSTPLAPLLVADAPAELALIAPAEGATRVVRGDSLHLRFNRPMVRSAEVGRPLEASPIVLTPPIAGTFRWTTRSSLVFTPDARAFDRNQEAAIRVAEGVASLDGETLYDDVPRVLVLDGSPRFLQHRSTVAQGQPLTMWFDAQVSATELGGEMFAWEVQGRRPIPIRISGGAFLPVENEDEAPRFEIQMTPGRMLEAGAQIAVAIAPRWDRYGGSYPRVVQFALAPRPRITGIGCEESRWGSSRCTFTEDPGQIVDIGPSLRLLASERLGGLSNADVTIVPPLRGLEVTLAGTEPELERVIAIAGEWEPDQVYEVRLGGLSTAGGERVVALAPLAVRSRGHHPSVEAPVGAFAYERGAPIAMRLRGIHTEAGRAIVRPVPVGREVDAMLSPASFAAQEAPITVPLASLVPDARPNRWGRGTLDVRSVADDAEMVVVAFQPTERGTAGDLTASFVQSTDLGVTAEALERGLLVWVSSIARASAVRGARVELRSAQNVLIAEGRTDALGAVWLRSDGLRGSTVQWSPLAEASVIVVRTDDDRAVLSLDPRRAVAPGELGLTASGVTDEEDSPLRATVIADRGAYRPGEPMHVLAIARHVEGAHARAPVDGDVSFRVMSSDSEEPIAEARVRMERGRADADWTLNEGIPLGTHRVEMVAADGVVLGATSITVAEFRQPRFRVDLAAPEGDVHEGDALRVAASARYLFGAPLEAASMRWSIAREGRASFPARYAEYAFGPTGGGGRQATLAEGEATLDATGAGIIGADVALAQAVRTRIRVEAEVTDGTGQTTAATRSIVAYPAAFEVGVRQPRAWTSLGTELSVEAIAVDHAGEMVVGQSLDARFVREGWHGWFEWHGSSEEDEGSFQQRRDQRREIVHTCAITSAAEPARCTFTPARGGTYVLEVEGRDDAGRSTIAQARVYVAGPDEHPDRDPPGAPIALTPSREEWSVGETAQLAFESPWEDAEALIMVHHGSLLAMERRPVGAGGQVIDVPLTDAMVPNVFVTVALIRGRTGEPGERIDLHSPDLRFGSASVQVRPRTSRLEVAIETEAAARPGTRVPVTVRVRDEEGRAVQGADVALWAVDEGTLRLTGYATPDPTRGLFVERGAAFALEDLRRALVSRIDPTIEAEASGDGGYGDEGAMDLEERERFDPTPLWAPRLVTDREGGATVEMLLPDRPTEYRLMAVAVDSGLRRGRAGTSLVAEQPLVVRVAFPRFATEGDRFEAVAFVHNAGETDVEAQVRFVVGGRARAARTVSIRAGGEARVSEPVSVGEGALLELGVEASATVDGEATAHTASARVPVVPAARWVRRRAVIGGAGERALDLAFGAEGARAPRGELRVAVASHPFVGLDGQLDALDESWWGGTEVEASRLLALSSYLRMSEGLRRDGRDEVELRARAERALDRVLRVRTSDGGFARWTAFDGAQPHETVLALRALGEAEAAGLTVPRGVREEGLRLLERLVIGGSFGESYGRAGQESWAMALRLLGEGGTRGPAIDSLYEQREFASPAALAWLALSLPEGDLRRDTALALAVHRLFPELVIEGLPKRSAEPESEYIAHDVAAFSAVLEAASRSRSGRRWMGQLASELLRQTSQRNGGIGGPLEIAQTMAALSACAERFGTPGALQASLSIDGADVSARVSGEQGALFEVPWNRVAQGAHPMVARAGEGEPLFVSLDARWAVPIGEAETVARGRAVTLHRVIETAAGTPLPTGSSVALGTMVRVRLFVHLEGAAPDRIAVRDPLGAGFESVDAGLRTTPHASLMALLGASPEDDATDPRGYHASRTLSYVEHRALDVHATTFYLHQLAPGLHELTYAVRATTPGTFVLPPASLEALHDDAFVARTTAMTLVVEP